MGVQYVCAMLHFHYDIDPVQRTGVSHFLLPYLPKDELSYQWQHELTIRMQKQSS